MRRLAIVVAVAAGIAGWVAPGLRAQAPAERKLQLTFNADGTVSLSAQGVATREILAEWRRLCGCTVVNAEKMPGATMLFPVMFDRAPQQVVLDSLLRQAAGYTLTPKREGSTSPSSFETIYILATSSPTSSSSYMATPQVPDSRFVTPGSPDDEIPPVTPGPQGAQPAVNVPSPNRPPSGAPGPGVFVPITPIGGSSTPTPPTTGRGGPIPPGIGRGGGAFQ